MMKAAQNSARLFSPMYFICTLGIQASLQLMNTTDM